MIDVQQILRQVSWVKWRLYRFSDCLEAHVCGETIENLVRQGREVPEPALRALGEFIVSHRQRGNTPFDAKRVADSLELDLTSELERRSALAQRATDDGPVVVMTGPPRSGSSDVLNHLVFETRWASFSDHSHHLWSPYNLCASVDRHLLRMSSCHLAMDTTAARLDPSVSWPSEGEQIFHRALPVASLVRWHEYELLPCVIRDITMLRRVIAEHRMHFGSNVLVSKSPFHAFRTDVLDELFEKVVVVLVDRTPGQSAASMRRQGFRYWVDGVALTSVEAERLFRRRVIDRADIFVDHDAFRGDPAKGVDKLRVAIERSIS